MAAPPCDKISKLNKIIRARHDRSINIILLARGRRADRSVAVDYSDVKLISRPTRAETGSIVGKVGRESGGKPATVLEEMTHRKMSQQLWSPGGGCMRPSLARTFRYAGPAVAVAGSTSTRCSIFFSDDETREGAEGIERTR